MNSKPFLASLSTLLIVGLSVGLLLIGAGCSDDDSTSSSESDGTFTNRIEEDKTDYSDPEIEGPTEEPYVEPPDEGPQG